MHWFARGLHSLSFGLVALHLLFRDSERIAKSVADLSDSVFLGTSAAGAVFIQATE
jgi:hypothetical protein